MKEKLVVGRGWGGRKKGSGCEYKRKTQGICTTEQVCILTVMVNVQICTYKTTESYTHTHTHTHTHTQVLVKPGEPEGALWMVPVYFLVLLLYCGYTRC